MFCHNANAYLLLFQNYIDEAMRLFYEADEKPFKFMDSWKRCRQAPKWIATHGMVTSPSAAKRKAEMSSSSSPQSTLALSVDRPERPVGSKKARVFSKVGIELQQRELRLQEIFAEATVEKNRIMEEHLLVKLFQGDDNESSREVTELLKQEALIRLRKRKANSIQSQPVIAQNKDKDDQSI